MSSIIVALITVASQCGGALLGSFVRRRAPDHHFVDDSKDVIKTATGMIATLVALVIGLLVSSAKSTYDEANDGLTNAGTKLILLDKTLGRYGPETSPIRTRLKQVVQGTIERLWPA